MADPNNPGQFGNRADTEIEASRGGQASHGGGGGSSKHAKLSKAGKKGAAAEPHAAKVEGGRRSHENR